MAESSLYAGDRDGPRILRIGRIGFDQGDKDVGSFLYTGTYRTERFAPAGPGSLVNFRRIAIHLLTSDDYKFTVKVWVDDERTVNKDAVVQTVVINNVGGALREETVEVVIEAEGSHIQIEIRADSEDIHGVFLIEGIRARGRVLRRSSSRAGEAV